ncbi:MAG: hypothetical protein QOD99_466 [Chthoniobacter sp.]|jgi:hypothetical protein|nr:hypothetical protein [Chthoniobacter sp.]
MVEHIKTELAVELDRARAKLARNVDAFRRDIDLSAHFKKSFRANRGPWIGAAAMLGLLVAKLPARKKKVYVDRSGKESMKRLEKAGLALALAKLALSAAKPALTAFATKKISDYSRRR